MFMRSLIFGVSLGALLGGAAQCRRDDTMRNSTPFEALSASVVAKKKVTAAEREVASRMAHMAKEQARLDAAKAIEGGTKGRRQRGIDAHYSVITGLKEQLRQAQKV